LPSQHLASTISTSRALALRRSQRHHHRIARKQVAAGEGDQGQADRKHRAHHQPRPGRISVRPDGEHQDRAEADVGARHRRADQERQRLVARLRRFMGARVGELVYSGVKHESLSSTATGASVCLGPPSGTVQNCRDEQNTVAAWLCPAAGARSVHLVRRRARLCLGDGSNDDGNG
jgi:hypothetical protein